MASPNQCRCRRCTIRSLTTPAIIITVGILLLLQQVHGGALSFHRTWPVILLVLGALCLGASTASTEGHIDSASVPPPQPPSSSPTPPPSLPGEGQ